MICAHPPEMDRYHNNVRLRHFHGCDSAKQRAAREAGALTETSTSSLQNKSFRLLFLRKEQSKMLL